MPFERLSKFLSQRGVGSRRKCDAIIQSGRVKVNNNMILQPFFRIDIHFDSVTIDTYEINQGNKLIYIALYKPVRYLSDLLSNEKRNVARMLIPIDSYIFPIGRLDYNSEGLMLFSNDGELANLIMHPKYGIEKEYLVKFKGILNETLVNRATEGYMIDGSLHRFYSIFFHKPSRSNSWYRITLKEGKNRIIRKIGNKMGHPVLKLIRVRIGPIQVGNLKPGEYRHLNESEKKALLKIKQTN